MSRPFNSTRFKAKSNTGPSQEEQKLNAMRNSGLKNFQRTQPGAPRSLVKRKTKSKWLGRKWKAPWKVIP